MKGTTDISNNGDYAVPTQAIQDIYVLTNTGDVEPLSTSRNVYFQKLWLYPGKAIASNALTLNTNAIKIGKRGNNLAGNSTTVVTDTLNPTDLPLMIQLPLGQKMSLNDVLISGTAGDGVFFCFT